MSVEFHWNSGAVEQVKREAVANIQRRVDPVRCPLHGTRVTVSDLGEGGQPLLDRPCCEELTKAIRQALS
jgi:hypothetical protein